MGDGRCKCESWMVTAVAGMNTTCRKFAVVSRIPTPDSTYYPIPYYASLFKGKWYDIKQLIGLAKESKLRNSAPIKYQIEISQKYWESIFRSEGIGHHRPPQAAGTHRAGEAEHSRLPHRGGEQRQSLVLHVLHHARRQGAARCGHQQD